MAEYRIDQAWSALHNSGTKFYRMLVVSSVGTSDSVLIRQWGKKGAIGSVEVYKLFSLHEALRDFRKIRREKGERGGYDLPMPDPDGSDQWLKNFAEKGNPVREHRVSALFNALFGSANTNRIFRTMSTDFLSSEDRIESVEPQAIEPVIDRSQIYGEAWGMF